MASMPPTASTISAAVTRPDRARPSSRRRGRSIDRRAALAHSSSASHPVAAEQRRRRERRAEVDDRLARQGVVGHGRSRPVAGGVRRLGGGPAQEPDDLAAPGIGPSVSASALATPAVAVQQPRSHRPAAASTAVSDGTIVDTATARGPVARRRASARRGPRPPGPVGVVLEPVGRRHDQLGCGTRTRVEDPARTRRPPPP